jgi:hypothetical protein
MSVFAPALTMTGCMPAGKFSSAGRGSKFSPCRLTKLENDSSRAFFTASFGTGTRNQPVAYVSTRSCLLSIKTILTANRAHGTVLLIVDSNLIWTCCALTSDETRGSKQYLEEKTCHDKENIVSWVLGCGLVLRWDNSVIYKGALFPSSSLQASTVLFVITLIL